MWWENFLGEMVHGDLQLMGLSPYLFTLSARRSLEFVDNARREKARELVTGETR